MFIAIPIIENNRLEGYASLTKDKVSYLSTTEEDLKKHLDLLYFDEIVDIGLFWKFLREYGKPVDSYSDSSLLQALLTIYKYRDTPNILVDLHTKDGIITAELSSIFRNSINGVKFVVVDDELVKEDRIISIVRNKDNFTNEFRTLVSDLKNFERDSDLLEEVEDTLNLTKGFTTNTDIDWPSFATTWRESRNVLSQQTLSRSYNTFSVEYTFSADSGVVHRVFKSSEE